MNGESRDQEFARRLRELLVEFNAKSGTEYGYYDDQNHYVTIEGGDKRHTLADYAPR